MIDDDDFGLRLLAETMGCHRIPSYGDSSYPIPRWCPDLKTSSDSCGRKFCLSIKLYYACNIGRPAVCQWKAVKLDGNIEKTNMTAEDLTPSSSFVAVIHDYTMHVAWIGQYALYRWLNIVPLDDRCFYGPLPLLLHPATCWGEIL